MRNSLLTIISNIIMKRSGKLPLETPPWLRYVDLFVVHPHCPERWQNLLNDLNSLKPSIQFTLDTEVDNAAQFLDIVVNGKGH
jgi:hypothetical protein